MQEHTKLTFHWPVALLVQLAPFWHRPAVQLSGVCLHVPHVTGQATLTAGLLLCGTLYLQRRAEMVSREVVILLVIFTTLLLCIRRAIWRKVVYSRYREGLETRNVLIVGAGRVAHALRNHLESLRHLGFRFKGFVALTEHEAESGDGDVIGDVRNCLSLARALFVDEIFFSVPAEKKLVISLVEEARAVGIDVRVVPDLYDGPRKLKISSDPRQGICYQCHAPRPADTNSIAAAANWKAQAGSGDDRTPMGVHEGLSCVACHNGHNENARASCATSRTFTCV